MKAGILSGSGGFPIRPPPLPESVVRKVNLARVYLAVAALFSVGVHQIYRGHYPEGCHSLAVGLGFFGIGHAVGTSAETPIIPPYSQLAPSPN